MKYIDSEKLIAEIERKIGICEKQRSDAIEVECYALADDASARMGELNVVLETIASLQQEQPEMELEKALDEYYKNADFGPSEAIEYETHKDIARHFYELGLNAKKEE